MSPETSDASGAGPSKPSAGSTPHATKDDAPLTLDEQERQRARARMKLRLAQSVAAVLGVLILIVVGLMVYLALRKYAENNAAPDSWSKAQRAIQNDAQSRPLEAGQNANVPPGLVGSQCELESSNLDSARLVLIFDGEASECSRLIIINTNTGALVLDRQIKGAS